MLLLLIQWAPALVPITFAAGFAFFMGSLKPKLIPQSEIDILARDLISRFEDPVGAAMIEEHAAWYRSNSFQQGKWRRVRKTIIRMQEFEKYQM